MAAKDALSSDQNTDQDMPLKLTKEIFENGCYKNPWKEWKSISILQFLKMKLWDKDNSNIPCKEVTCYFQFTISNSALLILCRHLFIKQNPQFYFKIYLLFDTQVMLKWSYT